MYAQAIDATGFDYETLKADKWVSGKIELVRRRTNLSWSHHQEVAAMESKDQDELLAVADREGMTRKELRQAVWEHKIAKQAASVAGPVPNQSDSLEAMVADGLKFGTIYALAAGNPACSALDRARRATLSAQMILIR